MGSAPGLADQLQYRTGLIQGLTILYRMGSALGSADQLMTYDSNTRLASLYRMGSVPGLADQLMTV